MQFSEKLSLAWETFKVEIIILKQVFSILIINRFYSGIKETQKKKKRTEKCHALENWTMIS